jgi:hypothetical protein
VSIATIDIATGTGSRCVHTTATPGKTLWRGMTAHPNSLTTLDYPRGNLAFRWFLADEVPARPDVRLVKVSDAPTSVD